MKTLMHKTTVLTAATLAPLKPGDYTLAVSVGLWQGTPEIALPLDSQIGATRRYSIGKIRVK